MVKKFLWLGVLGLLLPVLIKAQNQKLDVVKIADGVYGMIYSEARMNPVESNSIVIIGNEYVIVFDAHRTPAAAQTTIAEIRKLTAKPVRYVITSHWHDDHIFGNQAYQEAFPGVEFIAHKNTREDMKNRASLNIQRGIDAYETGIPRIEESLAKGVKSDGSAISAEERASITKKLTVYKEFLPKIKPIRLVLPTITFEERFTLYQDAREIQLLYFGLGNTRGDIVLYLPKEKVLLCGDLLVHPVPFAFGSHLGEWIKTMKEVQKIDAQVIIPGHGPVMSDKIYLNAVTELLESIFNQVKDSVARGLSLEETRKAVDLKAYHEKWVGQDIDREDTWKGSILTSAIDQTYKDVKEVVK